MDKTFPQKVYTVYIKRSNLSRVVITLRSECSMPISSIIKSTTPLLSVCIVILYNIGSIDFKSTKFLYWKTVRIFQVNWYQIFAFWVSFIPVHNYRIQSSCKHLRRYIELCFFLFRDSSIGSFKLTIYNVYLSTSFVKTQRVALANLALYCNFIYLQTSKILFDRNKYND